MLSEVYLFGIGKSASSFNLMSGERLPLTQTILPFNPFQSKPWFLRVCTNSLLKALWEKEKLLVMSNFSFSHSVFYPFGEFSAIFI